MKHSTNFTYQNISQTKRTGKVMIYAIIKVNGIVAKSRYSTGITILKKHWKRGQAYGFDGAKDINTSLNDLETQIRRLYNQLILNKKEVDADFLLSELKRYDRSLSKIYTINDLLEDFFEKKKKTIKAKRVSTLNSSIPRLLQYFEFVPFDTFREIDADFLSEMGQMIIDKKLYKGNTVKEDFLFLKGAIRYGVINEKIDHPGHFEKINLRFVKDPIEYLTKEELKTLWYSQNFLKGEELQAVRWMLFASYTGLSFSDIVKFDSKQHLRVIDGITHVIVTRSKTERSTGVLCHIPLHGNALELIQYFEGENRINYKYSNKPIRILERVAKKLEIDKHLTTKLGRSTFASLLISKRGISLESVQATLGHQYRSTTERYYAFFMNERLVAEWKSAQFDDVF